ncbi:hypothetical protein N182_07925 [Sinorhizobium sp. GL2]|nr:hypothetical protein N182_07925 [Sinorhizobium sp. GL2]
MTLECSPKYCSVAMSGAAAASVRPMSGPPPSVLAKIRPSLRTARMNVPGSSMPVGRNWLKRCSASARRPSSNSAPPSVWKAATAIAAARPTVWRELSSMRACSSMMLDMRETATIIRNAMIRIGMERLRTGSAFARRREAGPAKIFACEINSCSRPVTPGSLSRNRPSAALAGRASAIFPNCLNPLMIRRAARPNLTQ